MRVVGFLPLVFMTVGAQVNCNGGPLNVVTRGEVVAQHNRLRSSIARGQSSPGPTGGQNIYALSYDCTLEAQAQAHANRCLARRSSLETRPDAGENFFHFTGRANAPGAIAYSAMQWWNQVINRGWRAAADNVYTPAVHATGIDMYAQMAWGATTRIGCGIAQCKAFKSVVCQYRTGGPKLNEVMVQPGTGCTKHSHCTTFPSSTCDFVQRLCQTPNGTNTSPPATTTAPTATTTVPAARIQETCTAAPLLNDAIRDIIVKKHNEIRSQIAKSQSIFGHFRRGSNDMFALEYDCELEQQAQVIADACAPRAPRVPVAGQNDLYINPAPANPIELEDAALIAVEAQIAVFDPAVDLPMGPNLLPAVGYFAQLVNSRTTAVGCGYALCPGAAPNDPPRAVAICKYNPPRADVGKPYAPTSSNGCRPKKCAAVHNTATCDRTSGLCKLPGRR